jgi:SOS-response transcriptional repressor LexA
MPGYTIIEVYEGRMKTITHITLLAVISLAAAAPAALAQNSSTEQVPVVGSTPAGGPAQPSKTIAANREASADVYYYFTMGHVDEMQFEMTGQSELADQAIDSYKKALDLAPYLSVIFERLAEFYS